MNIESTLEKLGIASPDNKVYLALLKAGESPVGSLIKSTALHRELVYGALLRLEQQGLVQSVEKKKIRHYYAIDPKELVRKVQEKAELAKAVLPDLQKIFTESPLLVRVFEGDEGFEEIQKDIQLSLKDHEQYYVIGGAGRAWYEVVKEYYKTYHRKLQKRGIQMLTVTYANEAKGIAKYELPGFNPIRVLPETYAVPSSTMIYGDKIIIQIFGEEPVAIMVRSKSVSDSYKKYFDVLWKMARPFTA